MFETQISGKISKTSYDSVKEEIYKSSENIIKLKIICSVNFFFFQILVGAPLTKLLNNFYNCVIKIENI